MFLYYIIMYVTRSTIFFENNLLLLLYSKIIYYYCCYITALVFFLHHRKTGRRRKKMQDSRGSLLAAILWLITQRRKTLTPCELGFLQSFLSRFAKAVVRERTGEIHEGRRRSGRKRRNVASAMRGAIKSKPDPRRVTRNSQPVGRRTNLPRTLCLRVSPYFFFVPVLSSIYRGLCYSHIFHLLHTVCRSR